MSVNRERLDRLDITRKFSDRVVMIAMDAGLVSEEHFSIDGSLLQSHASLKSLRQIERLQAAADERGDDDKDRGGVGNPWVDCRGQKRSNATHRSVTDPEARLYTKTSGVAYLQHTMPVLMDNRCGIGVDIRVGVPDPEDRGAWARWYNQRGARDAGYRINQRKRKLTEEIFGWLKQYGGLQRSRVVGRWKIQQVADMASGTLNLVRMSKPLRGMMGGGDGAVRDVPGRAGVNGPSPAIPNPSNLTRPHEIPWNPLAGVGNSTPC